MWFQSTSSGLVGWKRQSNESATESVHGRSRPATAGELHRVTLPEPAFISRRRCSRRWRGRHAAQVHGGRATDDRPTAAHSTRRTDTFPLEHFQPTQATAHPTTVRRNDVRLQTATQLYSKSDKMHENLTICIGTLARLFRSK